MRRMRHLKAQGSREHSASERVNVGTSGKANCLKLLLWPESKAVLQKKKFILEPIVSKKQNIDDNEIAPLLTLRLSKSA